MSNITGNDWGSCVKNVQVDNGRSTVQVPSLDCIPSVFQNVIGAALLFAGVVALFFIIYSGIKFILSGGDAKQVEGARNTLTYAIIGLLVILLSFFIINLIGGITGVTCIQMFGFNNCK